MNAYSICVIVHVQMWCAYSISWWSNTKIFLSILYVFENVFMFLCVQSFSKLSIFFLVEKLFQKHFREYESTHENEEAIFSIFWNLHREFRNCFTGRSYLRNLSRCFRGHFTSNFTRNLPKKWAVLQFLKSNSDNFSNISILPPPRLSKPKTPFPSKSHPKLKINHS